MTRFGYIRETRARCNQFPATQKGGGWEGKGTEGGGEGVENPGIIPTPRPPCGARGHI